MSDSQLYRWPTKLKKFAISDPFQRMVVAKYEGEIPWQQQVRDPETLDRFIAEHMLPQLLERVAYPPRVGVRHHYVSAADVDLPAALSTPGHPAAADAVVLQATARGDGEAAALEALVELTNRRKARAFQSWVDACARADPESPAFQYLVLRSVFDLSGPGTRRPVVAPVAGHIAWLHRRIARGQVRPDRNLARLYCWRVGPEGQEVPRDGWQCIPRGEENAGRLASACHGSGWCVEREDMARALLADCHFYLLRHQGRPVVAVRYDLRRARVLECVGRQNRPPADWAVDVHLFLASQGLHWAPVDREGQARLGAAGGLESQPLEWWRERVRLWPLALGLAPAVIQRRLRAETSAHDPVAYVHFPAFGMLVSRLGGPQAVRHWRQFLQVDPERWHVCPESVLAAPEVRGTLLDAALERLRAPETTLRDLVELPPSVKKDPAYREAVMTHWWEALQRALRARPRHRRELGRRVQLGQVLPELPGEPSELALERAVNRLLTNPPGDFGALSLPPSGGGLARPGLSPDVVWWQAARLDPALRFLMPREVAGACPLPAPLGPGSEGELDGYVLRVRGNPLLLSLENDLPEPVRHEPRVLEAYRQGWADVLRRDPLGFVVYRGEQGRCLEMSPALLGDPVILEAMTEAWRRAAAGDCGELDGIERAWAHVKPAERDLPLVQLALLRAVVGSERWRVSELAYTMGRDIRERVRRAPDRTRAYPFLQEIAVHLQTLRLPLDRGAAAGSARSVQGVAA